MALTVTRGVLEAERLVGEARVQLPLRAEAAVPGAGRETPEVLMEDAFLTLGAAEAQADRVILGGWTLCQAVYRLGDDAQIRSLTAQTSFEHAFDVPGSAPKMGVRASGTVEHVEADYENGHMVFQVTVLLRVRVCALETFEPVTGVTDAQEVAVLQKELCSYKLNAEAASPVVLTEEIALPAALNARVALMQWATPRVEKAERDLGGARVSGVVTAETLVLSGVAGRPVALVKCSMPFETLIEFPDWIGGDADARVEVKRLDAELDEGEDGEESALRISCELEAQARVNGRDCVNAVCDLYATGNALAEPETRSVNLCAGENRVCCQEGFKGALMLPEGAPGAGTPLAARVRPVVAEIATENGSTTVTGVLEATVLYMPSGSDRASGARAELPFSIRCPGELDEDAWLDVTAGDAEAAAILSDRLELKCTIKVEGSSRVCTEEQIVTGVREAEAPARVHGLVIAFPCDNETLWDIAKRYRVTEASISALNESVPRTRSGAPLIVRV